MNNRPEILELWGAPFSGAESPSLQVITDAEVCNSIALVVAPNGFEKYPKYLVKFDEIYGFKVLDETKAPVHCYATVHRSAKGCVYTWKNSPWISEVLSEIRFAENQLSHFVFFGGDIIVEILAKCPPTFEEVRTKMDIVRQYAV